MINVVKIGGNVIDNPDALRAFVDGFSRLAGPKILVHGGGKEATRLSAAMGLTTRMVNGRRVTDRDTIDVVTMVYAGLINKRIVSALQAVGCDAIGLTGADGDSLKACRRPPVEMEIVSEGKTAKEMVDFGFVGDIPACGVNVRFISMLLNSGLAPVFCAICYDGRDTLLNCNADSVAAAVAVGASQIGPTRLTYCFEKPGVLTDVNDDSSVIPVVTAESFESLRVSGVVAAGMLPKVQNALKSVEDGVAEVRICGSDMLMTPGGTTIR